MSDFIRVKSALDIKTVILSELGVGMASNAKHLPACPFCGGKDCFSVRKPQQDFHCFQCAPEAHGDVFTFLERYYNLDKAGALKRAAEIAGIKLEEKAKRKPSLTTTEKIRVDAADYYHARALELGKPYFLELRGHLPATMEQEKLGWSDGHLLDHLRKKGFTDKEILESGLAKEKEIEGGTRILDFFGKGLAVFPHFSHQKVVHFTMKDARDVPKDKKLNFQLPADQRDKRWIFYGQDVMERYEEVILVEGEDDRLQVLNTGLAYVMAMIGQISEEQTKALSSRCRGKHLYLWVDNDAAGQKYVRKICRALPEISVRIIVYGKAGDDPDSYLKGFEGDRKREVRRLQQESLDYICWEISVALTLPFLELRLGHLQAPAGDDNLNIFRLIGKHSIIQQQVYAEKLQALGFSQKAIEEQLDFSQDLYKQITDYFTFLDNPKDACPIQLAELCFKFFAHHGRFYYDREDTVYLIYQNRTYTVDNNTRFNSLMLKLTRMIISKSPGNMVWDAMKHTAYLNGRMIDMCQWIHTDVVKDTIFMNLNSPNNTILKISRDRIDEIQNGMNDDHILLSSSGKIQPFNFLPDTDIQEGMTYLKELLFDGLAVKREQRFMILCWMISGLCPDMAPYQFLMKFAGYASSGKSTAAKAITTLIYGNDQLSDPSGAAAFSAASQNPLLVIDNLEHKDLTRGMTKFLLLAATRGQKEKRKGGTDTDTVDESPRALICITAIEPFTLSELISRTFEIQFDRRIYGSDNYHESEVMEQLKKKRDLILSAIIRFLQKEILPNLRQRTEFMTILNKQFKGHAKDRTNAYLALLMLILEKLLKYIPFYPEGDLMHGVESGDKDIYTAWIEEQNSSAKETELGSNHILQLFDGLVREYMQYFKGRTHFIPGHENGYEDDVFVMEHPEYGLRMIKTIPETYCSTCGLKAAKCKCGGERYSKSIIEFVATSGDVVDAFDKLAKNTGKRNPYESASIFTARLRNDKSLLAKSGWGLVEAEGKEPYFKIISGARFFKFRHELVR